MIGRRVHDLAPHEMQPGDYGRWAADHDNWYACCPNGLTANLSRHGVIEHDDGTISVKPSILCTGYGSTIMVTQPTPEGEQSWHGFLEQGVWRQV